MNKSKKKKKQILEYKKVVNKKANVVNKKNNNAPKKKTPLKSENNRNVKNNNIKNNNINNTNVVKKQIPNNKPKKVNPNKNNVKVAEQRKYNNNVYQEEITTNTNIIKTNNLNNNSRKKKNSIKRVSKKKKLIVIISTTIIIVLITVISLLIYLPCFKLVNITVNGNNKVLIEQILQSSRLTLGKNIFISYFNIDKEIIKSIPYINNVNVKISNNDTINIEVTERESIYYAYDKEYNVYYKLDETGKVLEKFDTPEYRENELIVSGITFDNNHKIGTNINNIDYNRLKTAKIIENEIINVIKDVKISKITLENELFKLKINDKLEVTFNSIDEIKYNVVFLNKMILEIGITDGEVDFTKENPIFIRHN